MAKKVKPSETLAKEVQPYVTEVSLLVTRTQQEPTGEVQIFLEMTPDELVEKINVSEKAGLSFVCDLPLVNIVTVKTGIEVVKEKISIPIRRILLVRLGEVAKIGDRLDASFAEHERNKGQ